MADIPRFAKTTKGMLSEAESEVVRHGGETGHGSLPVDESFISFRR